MSVQVNTNTKTVSIQNAHQTITIVDNENNNVVNVSQPLVNVIEVATPGPQGPAGPAGTGGNTSGFATTGSNTFVGNQSRSGNLIPAGPYVNNTSSYNLGSPTQAWKEIYVSNGSIYFLNGNTSSSISLDNNGNIALPSASLTGSLEGTASLALRASGSLTGSLLGTSSWASNSTTASYVSGNIFTSTNPALSASYALTASYAMNGGGTPVDTSTFVTTSSFNNYTSSINSFTSSVNSTLSNVAIINGGNSFVGVQTIEGPLSGNVTEVTEATASILDCSTGNFFFLNLSADTNITISLINLSPGQTVNLRIRMGGGNTVNLDSNIYEPVSSPYTPSPNTGQEDILTFISFAAGARAYMSYVKNLA